MSSYRGEKAGTSFAVAATAGLMWLSMDQHRSGGRQAFLRPPGGWVQQTAIPHASGSGTAPVQILLMDRQVKFEGRSEEIYLENALRVQTPQGLNGVGTVSFAWNPDTDTVTVHRLRILRNDKTIDVLAGGQKFTIWRAGRPISNTPRSTIH